MIKQNFNKILSEPFSLSLLLFSLFIYSLIWVIGLNSNWIVMSDLLGLMLLFRYLENNLEFNFFEIISFGILVDLAFGFIFGHHVLKYSLIVLMAHVFHLKFVISGTIQKLIYILIILFFSEIISSLIISLFLQKQIFNFLPLITNIILGLLILLFQKKIYFNKR
jgi:cell shape-determining protein MreD